MKKLAIAAALCCALIGSPVQAKTFVGVLWPMFGPLPAIGLVELVAELKMMPDVEVETYVHQAWPSLVKDLDRQPPGTHTVVVGYSLGANSSVFVANNAKYVDLIIALQPSMLSWNPEVTGKVGRMIEIYNPNPWETFGGMGSKKLIGPNIQYIANNDSHPGAQFDPQFRNLVKSEVAKYVADDRAGGDIETAEAKQTRPVVLASLQEPVAAEPVAASPSPAQRDAIGERIRQAEAEAPKAPQPQAADPPARIVAQASKPAPRVAAARQAAKSDEIAAFLEKLSSSVNSGDLSEGSSRPRRLTVAELKDYAARTYRNSRTAQLTTTASD